MFDRFPLFGFLVSFAGLIGLGAGVSHKSPTGRAAGFLAIGLGVLLVGIHAVVRREWRWGRKLRYTRRGFGALWRGLACIAGAAVAAYAAWWTLGQP